MPKPRPCPTCRGYRERGYQPKCVCFADRPDPELRPRDGWAYVGCRECGNVTTVPLDRVDEPPFCAHSGTMISWRASHPDTTPPWTPMVRVRVSPTKGP